MGVPCWVGLFLIMENEEFNLGELCLIEKLSDRKCKYLCFCGKEFITDKYSVKSGATKSCGCYHRYLLLQRVKTHGDTNTRLNRIWRAVKSRCLNKNNKCYNLYGGRNITICNEWLSYEPFKNWALNNGYEDKLTIDRIDNDKNYEPNNCRWITNKIQSINRRTQYNKTGIRGISQRKNRWLAAICIEGKVIFLGSFSTPEEASVAYEKARTKREESYLKEFEQSKNKNK